MRPAAPDSPTPLLIASGWAGGDIFLSRPRAKAHTACRTGGDFFGGGRRLRSNGQGAEAASGSRYVANSQRMRGVRMHRASCSTLRRTHLGASHTEVKQTAVQCNGEVALPAPSSEQLS
eukprot:7093677-Pyramimonas_sp.AAC.1